MYIYNLPAEYLGHNTVLTDWVNNQIRGGDLFPIRVFYSADPGWNWQDPDPS